MTGSRQERERPVRRRSLAVRGVLGFVAVLAFCGWRLSPSKTDSSLDSAELVRGFADESQCIDCHEQAESFFQTGHARTMRRASDPESLEQLRKLVAGGLPGAEGLTLQITPREVRAVHTAGGRASDLRLDWCFGSADHARTWVGTLSDSWGSTDLVEFRWSWYHSLDGFDITPGQPEKGNPGYFQGLGVLFDQPKARDCFQCHTTHVAFPGGRLDPETIRPGVTCQRCHGPSQAHVESEGEILNLVWREADQRESINRCAVCHRRAEDEDPGDISTDNTEIVRFQPIGLVQSACFRGSPELTCTSCHNPHLPLQAQDSAGIWQCLQCHEGGHESGPETLGKKNGAPGCAAGHRDDCVRCHMPKVPFNQSVSFTDHWIRIRSRGEDPE